MSGTSIIAQIFVPLKLYLLGSSNPSKNVVKVGPSLTKLSGPAHVKKNSAQPHILVPPPPPRKITLDPWLPKKRTPKTDQTTRLRRLI